ncbi:MAG: sodium/proline symporter [Clostridia bacterium]|nr:sodium/proline symporter [Clostridia bacterium]
MNLFEVAAFILYFLAVLAIGIFFFIKSKNESEKDYFLGGKSMGGLVSALSAGASDMSAWCLMGLPGAIYLSGLGQVWISVGLIIGTILAWIFVAPRLRVYAIHADDAITIPQFLTNRFRTKNSALRIICAVVFVVAYCIYMASSVVACGELFSTLTGGVIDKTMGMIIAAAVIVLYTMLGGFRAVCWTDFLQGMLMLAAVLILPIIALIFVNSGNLPDSFLPWVAESENYYNFLSDGAFNWKSISDILTGLSWGLGYFGMPHILVRYMSIKNKKEMRKSQIVGSTWTFLILVMASVLGLVAHEFLGSSMEGNTNLVFVTVVRKIFDFGALAFIGGILISAVVAASMSTADSQLLASSSAFASDIYKAQIRKEASDKEMVWVSRIVVIVVAIVALIIALTGSSIMALVSAAWSIFGAAFGPAILLSLYWKRFNYKGCAAGIVTGFVVSVLWMVLFNFEYYGFTSIVYNTNLYEILPGFILGLIASVATSLLTEKPDEAVVELFEKVQADEDLH